MAELHRQPCPDAARLPSLQEEFNQALDSHKPADVNQWLKDHPDWSFHFTPTSASWMNAVAGSLAKLSRQRLGHAIFNSLDECITVVEGYIEHHNAADTRPFRWSKEPDDLVEVWKRGTRSCRNRHRGKLSC